jgi:hypothetical protein
MKKYFPTTSSLAKLMDVLGENESMMKINLQTG